MIRTALSLDGTWELFADPGARLGPGTLPATGAYAVRVPGPWQAQVADLRTYTGVAWYRRTFTAPGAPGDGRVWLLRFGAVEYHATVWLNGQALGEHEGGYLPFELRADQALLPGLNELVVRVFDPGPGSADSPFPFDEVPHGKQSWYGPLGGIWQTVMLEARHPTHLASLKVTPDLPGERARVAVALSAPHAQPQTVTLRLVEPGGRGTSYSIDVPPGADQVALDLPVPSPLLWDTETPNLYRLEARLYPGDPSAPSSARAAHRTAQSSALDALETTFGMRAIATSPDGRLLLNGRPIYLRGALDQDYYPELICTAFSDEELDAQFARARHMGLNCLRTHIKVADPRYYAAADRAGVLIWTELPNWELLTEGAKRRARDTLQGMVARDWNHPSIIIWTIINEGWGTDLLGNPKHRAWLAETYAWLKELDPTRLVVGNSACEGNFHVVTDLEDFHNYYAMPDHYERWRLWVSSFAGRAPWSYAYEVASLPELRRFKRNQWAEGERIPSPETRRRGDEPLLVSEFGTWGLPDVGRLKAAYGGEPWWFETGFEWSDGAVYPHGIEHRFAAYHLDKVFGDLAGLAAASQRAQYAALKEQIEQLRRHPSIAGYVITEFTDVHWEANGLLDIWRNPKACYDVIGTLNADDVLIPAWERTAYHAGEYLELPVLLAYASGRDLSGAQLEWRIDPWPTLRGAEPLPAPGGPVALAAVVRAELPHVARPTRARVELRLSDAAGAPIAASYQDLYVFPHRPATPSAPLFAPDGDLAESLAALGYTLAGAPSDAALTVTNVLTPELRRHARDGGRVLLLAESRGALRADLGKIKLQSRKGTSRQGDWASTLCWLRPDTMFGTIPSLGQVDFGFAGLTPDHVITGVAPRDYAGRVHAGLFIGWVQHSAALVAEQPVGRGLVLISTFRLRERLADNPLAQELIRTMVAWLAGESDRVEP